MVLEFLKRQKKRKKTGEITGRGTETAGLDKTGSNPGQFTVKSIEDVPFEERILLIAHCIRPSKSCNARFSSYGLMCLDDCPNNCSIGRLRKLAESLGYKGICIAPGGKMTVKFIEEKLPEGIVAIACHKELEEGIEAISHLVNTPGFNGNHPAVATIPLTRDGCIDTEVNLDEALRVIEKGISKKNIRGGSTDDM